MKKARIGINILSGIFFGIYFLCSIFYSDMSSDIFYDWPLSMQTTISLLIDCFANPTQFNLIPFIIFVITQILMSISIISLSIGTIIKSKKIINFGIILQIIYTSYRIYEVIPSIGVISLFILLLGNIIIILVINNKIRKLSVFGKILGNWITPPMIILIAKIYRIIYSAIRNGSSTFYWLTGYAFPLGIMCLIELLTSVGAYFLLSMWLAYPEGLPARVASKRTPLAVNATEELKTYKQLLEAGAITQEEFDTKKKQLLGL